MNREILFRGKDIKTGEWIEGNLIIARDGQPYIMPSDIFEPDGHHLIIDSDNPFWVDPDTVGQLTDQLDLDEKKIFEGDKVSAYGGNIFNVVFYKSAFQLEQAKTKVIVPFSTFDGNFEVIGNIHDHE